MGREGERGRETSMCGCLLHSPYWGPDLARNLGMCPDWESNPWPFSLQTGPQSTGPHQPGPALSILKTILKWTLSIFMFFYFFSNAAVYINLESYMRTWESFVSDVRREMESAKVSYKIVWNSVKIRMMVIIRFLSWWRRCVFFV